MLHRYVFVEYGPMELDLNLRVRVHELEAFLEQKVRASPGSLPVPVMPQPLSLPCCLTCSLGAAVAPPCDSDTRLVHQQHNEVPSLHLLQFAVSLS